MCESHQQVNSQYQRRVEAIHKKVIIFVPCFSICSDGDIYEANLEKGRQKIRIFSTTHSVGTLKRKLTSAVDSRLRLLTPPFTQTNMRRRYGSQKKKLHSVGNCFNDCILCTANETFSSVMNQTETEITLK